MPIKKEDLDKLKTTLKGVDVDKMIAAAVATDEQPFEVPADLSVLTAAELSARDANVTATAQRAGEATGETKGKELAAKAFRKKFNLPDTIGVDIDKVVEAVNTELNKGDAGLKEQVTKLLADKTELETKVKETESKATAALFDAELIGMFPAGRTGDLQDHERLMLIKNQIEFVDVDGKKAAKLKKDGKIIEDSATHAPLPLDQAMKTIFTERKWIGEGGGGNEGGRGGGNSGGGAGGSAGIKQMSKYIEQWKVNNPGKNHVSPEFDADLAKHTKDVTDFDWNA